MDNKNDKPELNVKMPPPVVPKKEGDSKGAKKKLLIIIPIIAVLIVGAVVTAVLLKNNKDKLPPVVVTDYNGEVVTDENGVPVTVVPDTEIFKYTNVAGEKLTSIIYKEETVYVPKTDIYGEKVTDKDGNQETNVIHFVPSTDAPGNVVVGSSAVPVTDGQGNTALDNQGNVYTTIIDITSMPAIVDPASIDWKNSRGGTQADYFSSVDMLKDGSYIGAIVTNSTDGDFGDYKDSKYGTPYTVLVKYKKNGDIDWQKPLGVAKRGTSTIITSIVATEDGGFYAVGYGTSIGGDTGKGYYDGGVFKFNEKGEQEWFKSFGTSTVDIFNGATLAPDGGVIVVGSVGNNDGDASGFGKPELKSAACIVKYSQAGELVFKNIIGGNKDVLNGVVVGTDGDIYCVGNFYSGDLFDALGSSDGGVVKFSSSGKYVDIAPIAGSKIENFTSITACKNGGVVVVGNSNSSDAGNTDSFFVSDLASRGGHDAYIVKLDMDLTFIFAKAFRGQNDDHLTSVIEKEDGSFIVAGYSNSSSRDFKGITTRGGNDMVIAEFDKYGSLSWARSFGGTKDDSANALCLSKDGGYIVAGRTLSKDIDMKGIAQYINGQSVGVIVKFPE